MKWPYINFHDQITENFIVLRNFWNVIRENLCPICAHCQLFVKAHKTNISWNKKWTDFYSSTPNYSIITRVNCKNIESHIVPQHKVITLKPCLLYVWKQFFRLQCSIMIMNAIVLFISQLFFYVVFVCRFVLLKLRYDGTFNGPLLAQTYSTEKFPIERQLLKYLIIMMVWMKTSYTYSFY